MAWSTPRTWVAGEKPSATTMNTHIRDQFDALEDAWTSYSPTWSGAGGNPAIGNGTLTAEARQIGKMIDFSITITMGSTTTYGSGQWGLTLPASARRRTIFDVFAYDASVPSRFRGIMEVSAASSSGLNYCEPTTAGTAYRNLNPTTPFTWTTSDILSVRGTYEAA